MKSIAKLVSLAAGVVLLAGAAHANPEPDGKPGMISASAPDQLMSLPTFTVDMNRTVPLRLATPAASIVIGNPMVADVSLFDANLLFITGKSFGSTNLLIFDASGNLIYSNDISVRMPNETMLRIVRGTSVQSYDCAPNCRSVLNAGDDPAYFSNVLSQNRQISDAAGQ